MNIVTRIAMTAALALTASTLLSRPAFAFTSHDRGTAKSDIEVADGLAARPYRAVAWNKLPNAAKPAWSRFIDDVGGTWEALWDADTGVPHRIMGSGVLVPGSVSSPAQAERYVRALLARHVDLFAPGNRADDFVVVSNHLDRGMRTIGMVQRHAGLPVVGGQVSFRFKNDRLFVIGSEALAIGSRSAGHSDSRSGPRQGRCAELDARRRGHGVDHRDRYPGGPADRRAPLGQLSHSHPGYRRSAQADGPLGRLCRCSHGRASRAQADPDVRRRHRELRRAPAATGQRPGPGAGAGYVVGPSIWPI